LRGRKPKPDVDKHAQGNPGKRRYNRREIDGQVRKIRPPKDLARDPVAWRTWLRLTAILARRRLLREEDTVQLGILCQAYSVYSEAAESLMSLPRGNRLLVKRGSGGVAPNPLVALMNQQASIIQRLGTEFGLSPVARARIDLDPAGPELEGLDALLGGLGEEPEPTSDVLN